MLDVRDVEPVLVPADCVDGFGGCYWNRPEAYLEPEVQAGMSCFAQTRPRAAARAAWTGCARDLETGALGREVTARCGPMAETDLGYRLVVAGLP